MTGTDIIGGGNIEPRALEDEMRSAYLDYAMSVIVGRALPDVRDGLKPVHRRVLYSMSEQGLGPTRPRAKSAAVVGDVMGKYHPHGDSAIYDTLVRMAQDFSMRYTLVDGQGNFGSIDDDPAAAMRYTEARLTRLAMEMLRDLDQDTVDFIPTYDGNHQEPLVLPARFPNLLVNGSTGIAVGMATNIPPHNLREVTDAVIAYIDDPNVTADELMRHVKGPDFPTGGIIVGYQGIRDAYETGRGRVRVRARVGIEEIGQGKEALIVTELPYAVKKGGDNGLITKIADLVHDKKIPDISDLRDESDRHGMRLVIELKRGTLPKVVLNQLYKHTAMQSTFGVNMVALVDGIPRTLSLKQVIAAYVAHQREVIVRRTKYELSEKERRAHILEGLLIAIDNLDAVIELIRASRDRESARTELMSRFELTQLQATAILDLRLSQLTALESDEIRNEHADVVERIKELRAILGDESRVLGLIKEELGEIAERFADDRRTEITASEDEIDIEDLIADQQMVITITKSGYIKSLPLTTYRKQHRGGRRGDRDGHEGRRLHRAPLRVLVARLPALLLQPRQGLSLQGLRAARGAAHGEGPRAGQRPAAARGRAHPVGALHARLRRVASTSSSRPRTGTVKKTEFGAYNTPIKADGIIAIKIRDDDELVAVRRVDPGEEILMISKEGLAVRFEEEDARAMGRDTGGVRGMNISGEGNQVLTMDVARDDQEVLVVTENGFGKRTPVSEYRKTSRGAKGVQTIKFSEKRGGLAAALVVRPHQELLFISQEGMVQRTGVRGIRQTGRSAQGVTLMNVRDDDRVSAVALVVESDAPTAAVGGRRHDDQRRGGRRRRRAARGAGAGLDGEPARPPRARGRRRGRRSRTRTRTLRTGIESSLRLDNLGSPEKGGGPYK